MRRQSAARYVAGLSLAAVLAGLTPMAAAAATHTVEAGFGGGNVFAPRTLSIPRGDRIRWDDKVWLSWDSSSPVVVTQ